MQLYISYTLKSKQTVLFLWKLVLTQSRNEGIKPGLSAGQTTKLPDGVQRWICTYQYGKIVRYFWTWSFTLWLQIFRKSIWHLFIQALMMNIHFLTLKH